MTATADPRADTVRAPKLGALDRAAGLELLGDVHGSGYKEGVALVRRPDGQIVQLGPLMYALLFEADGERTADELAESLSQSFGRRFEPPHVLRLAQKLAAQGLLAGSEQNAPPRRNPLLAMRWKVLVTKPELTRRLTAPFMFLFRPWLMWPLLACFVVVFWFVLIHKGVASATADAFHSPALLLLVFVLAIASAGFHELGHASACRYGGGTPGGMGMGIYMVWPAFYTDVTDAYRLPRRDRLRIDLAGLYFNAVVAVATMAVWLAWRVDALLLLVALQILQMVKQLSPVIRADGYHILSDATGIPDLYSHIGPTLRQLLPWRRREPSALKGRARLLVTLWVLIVVPVLLSLMLGAIVLLPRLATSAWESGRAITAAIPHESTLNVLASLVHLLALFLPVAGSLLIAQKIIRNMGRKGLAWTRGRPVRRATLAVAMAGLLAGAAWAWWPSGQYRPVAPSDRGTLTRFATLVAAPVPVARPAAAPARVQLAPGTHLAVAMVPRGGATRKHPALFVIEGGAGKPAVAIVSDSSPDPQAAPSTTGSSSSPTPTTTTPTMTTTTTITPTTTTAGSSPAATVGATAFQFKLPAPPGPGDTQALAVNTTDGGVVYDIAYALVTVAHGAPVTNTNGAFAFANCKACTTVAVSFQLVLIVGESKQIGPIDAAGALNVNCPACVTTAIADQIVVTLTAQPSRKLIAKLDNALSQLNALPELGAGGTPAAVAAEVTGVEQQIETTLNESGLLAHPIGSTATTPTTPTTSTTGSTTMSPAVTSPATTTPSQPSTPAQPSPSQPQPSTGAATTPTTPATTEPSSTVSTTTTGTITTTPTTGTTTTTPTESQSTTTTEPSTTTTETDTTQTTITSG
ncbi:MAG TPA: hypothetical protein VGL76_02555 [Gaiellaceae bacterium]|jgi:putative peptide zinc metalloprotease protein